MDAALPSFVRSVQIILVALRPPDPPVLEALRTGNINRATSKEMLDSIIKHNDSQQRLQLIMLNLIRPHCGTVSASTRDESFSSEYARKFVLHTSQGMERMRK